MSQQGLAVLLWRSLGNSTVCILATDISSSMINIVKMRYSRELTDEKKSWFSCHGWPKPGYCNRINILHRMRIWTLFFLDRIKGLRETYRVLKPGGASAIAVWKANPIPLLVEKAPIEEGTINSEKTPSPMTKIVSTTALIHCIGWLADSIAAGPPPSF